MRKFDYRCILLRRRGCYRISAYLPAFHFDVYCRRPRHDAARFDFLMTARRAFRAMPAIIQLVDATRRLRVFDIADRLPCRIRLRVAILLRTPSFYCRLQPILRDLPYQLLHLFMPPRGDGHATDAERMPYCRARLRVIRHSFDDERAPNASLKYVSSSARCDSGCRSISTIQHASRPTDYPSISAATTCFDTLI